jgi:hypothetical protein
MGTLQSKRDRSGLSTRVVQDGSRRSKFLFTGREGQADRRAAPHEIREL